MMICVICMALLRQDGLCDKVAFGVCPCLFFSFDHLLQIGSFRLEEQDGYPIPWAAIGYGDLRFFHCNQLCFHRLIV